MKLLNAFLFLAITTVALSCNNTVTEKENPAKTWATAHEMNTRLGKGINIGNTFEAMPSWATPFDKADLKRIADLGFTHVRIPIRWERDDRSSVSAPYAIRPEFLKTIQSVVDEALKNNLHIIINMHHHDALIADPTGQKARFIAQWQQISDYFKNYPDSLLFEILNEPNGTFTTDIWNQYSKEALQIIRATNPQRCVLLGVAEWGGVGGLKALDIPADNHLILTIHYYNPFHFTHQGASWSEGSEAWVGTKWQDTEWERQAVEEDFKFAKQLAQQKNIPIHIGEFGSFSRADMESRVKWTRFLTRWFEKQGFSWAYWEWNSGFGIYDPKTQTYRTELINAMLKDVLPAPFQPETVQIYQSNFSNGQNDGWFLTNNDISAASSVKIADNKANITISKPGTQNWHIQFIKPNISIQQGNTYRLLFTAYSPDSDAKNIDASVTKASDPWTTYGSASFLINKTAGNYNLVFTPTLTDEQARIVFNLGNSGTSGVTLSDIRLMKIMYQ